MDNFAIFGNTNYAYQYITETFPDQIEFDISQIKIWSLDIETSAEYGFPDVQNPVEAMLLITIQDYNTKQITTFGSKPANSVKENHTYIECKDEYDLLKRFVNFISSDYPHVITGWNIEFFDIPYLCNRIKKILCEDLMKQMSPWGNVYEREISRFKNTEIVFDIQGISVLDYLDLYRKFTYTAQESYKLDHIANVS